MTVSLHRETDEVSTNTKTGASAGCTTDGRRKHIEQGKGGSSGYGNHDDFLNLHLLLRDVIGGNSHGSTLNEILDGTLDDLLNIDGLAQLLSFTANSLHYIL
jgi:hypothetical protein